MPAEKLIFASVVEPLLDVARKGKVSPETEKKLAGIGMPMWGKTAPAYPAERWAEAVRIIGADLFPQAEPDEQHRGIGLRTIEQFTGTFIGKALMTAARLWGPRRSLQRLTNNLRTGANFLETRFTHIDDRQQELWINDVSGVPGFYAGLIGAGSQYIEGWSDSVAIKQREGDACLYELRVTR
jgi:uncharacterized protein (TIGR02265 family)